MTKHCVNWKPVKSKDIRGSDFDSPIPTAIEIGYRGTMLSRILDMERKQSITFVEAIHLVQKQWTKAVDSGRIGHELGECNWFIDHFIEWVASQGYHIELTGDEFEPYMISSQII